MTDSKTLNQQFDLLTEALTLSVQNLEEIATKQRQEDCLNALEQTLQTAALLRTVVVSVDYLRISIFST